MKLGENKWFARGHWISKEWDPSSYWLPRPHTHPPGPCCLWERHVAHNGNFKVSDRQEELYIHFFKHTDYWKPGSFRLILILPFKSNLTSKRLWEDFAAHDLSASCSDPLPPRSPLLFLLSPPPSSSHLTFSLPLLLRAATLLGWSLSCETLWASFPFFNFYFQYTKFHTSIPKMYTFSFFNKV